MTVATREQYFDAAMELLADQGSAALTIAALCDRFGVTIGSFYHHFRNVDAFVDALLENWEREQTLRIIELTAAPPDPLERISRLKALAVGLPHGAEAAIRAWAKTNPRVAAVQARVDDERLTALSEVIAGVVPDAGEARRLAVFGMSLLIGLQQWRLPIDPAELRAHYDEFERAIMRGAAPSGARRRRSA